MLAVVTVLRELSGVGTCNLKNAIMILRRYRCFTAPYLAAVIERIRAPPPSYKRLLHSHFSHRIMSTSSTEYPPAAHPYHDKPARQPAITDDQRGRATMPAASVSDSGKPRVRKARRLRGGFLNPFLLFPCCCGADGCWD